MKNKQNLAIGQPERKHPMTIFISWSGPRSHEIAEALYDWLPTVLQAIQPWMSTKDIGSGARWSLGMASQLERIQFGLICLTPENLEAPWIHFEVGALSKTLDDTYVCPYLFDLEPADLAGPLVQFQAARATKEDTKHLVQTINQALGDEALPEERINRAFERWWPDLEERLRNIPAIEEEERPERSEKDMIQELLELVRSLMRTQGAIARASAPAETTIEEAEARAEAIRMIAQAEAEGIDAKETIRMAARVRIFSDVVELVERLASNVGLDEESKIELIRQAFEYTREK